jgi:hypothetical protein
VDARRHGDPPVSARRLPGNAESAALSSNANLAQGGCGLSRHHDDTVRCFMRPALARPSCRPSPKHGDDDHAEDNHGEDDHAGLPDAPEDDAATGTPLHRPDDFPLWDDDSSPLDYPALPGMDDGDLADDGRER